MTPERNPTKAHRRAEVRLAIYYAVLAAFFATSLLCEWSAHPPSYASPLAVGAVASAALSAIMYAEATS